MISLSEHNIYCIGLFIVMGSSSMVSSFVLHITSFHLYICLLNNCAISNFLCYWKTTIKIYSQLFKLMLYAFVGLLCVIRSIIATSGILQIYFKLLCDS